VVTSAPSEPTGRIRYKTYREGGMGSARPCPRVRARSRTPFASPSPATAWVAAFIAELAPIARSSLHDRNDAAAEPARLVVARRAFPQPGRSNLAHARRSPDPIGLQFLTTPPDLALPSAA